MVPNYCSKFTLFTVYISCDVKYLFKACLIKSQNRAYHSKAFLFVRHSIHTALSTIWHAMSGVRYCAGQRNEPCKFFISLWNSQGLGWPTFVTLGETQGLTWSESSITKAHWEVERPNWKNILDSPCCNFFIFTMGIIPSLFDKYEYSLFLALAVQQSTSSPLRSSERDL